MVAKDLPMNPCVKGKRINVRENGIKKKRTQPFALQVIKVASGREVIENGGEDLHPHSNLLLSCFFAASQSSTRSLSSASRCSVLANSFWCQAGDSNSPSGRLKSSQSASISLSFSLRGNCCTA